MCLLILTPVIILILALFLILLILSSQVDVRIPIYRVPTWTGYVLNNPQVYPSWATPEEHSTVKGSLLLLLPLHPVSS